MRSSLPLLVLLLLGNALPAVAGSGWVPLPNAPTGSHFEDTFFVDPMSGWVVDGAGRIHRTTNGGDSWQLQVDEPAYLRSVGFADAQRGYAGNLNGTPLLYTTTNGGAAWTPVVNIPEPRPTGICGIWVVNASVAYGCGKYDATSARVIKTTDGGASWTSMDLAPLATSLIDCYFFDEDHGFVVGGIGEPAAGGGEPLGERSGDTRRAVILGTTNGGATWTTRHTTNRLGEWCWKISFPTPSIGYVSIERFSGSTYFLKTTDGGQTWAEHLFRDNYIVQGIGFVTRYWAGPEGPPDPPTRAPMAVPPGTWRGSACISTASGSWPQGLAMPSDRGPTSTRRVREWLQRPRSYRPISCLPRTIPIRSRGRRPSASHWRVSPM